MTSLTSTHWAYRRSQRLFQAPASLESLEQCAVAGIEFLRPGCQALGLAVKGNHVVVSFVSSLFVTRLPRDVARLINAIVVASFKCVFGRRTRANILNERFNRVSPSVTDRDAPRTVVGIGTVAWVVATSDHSVPGRVKRMPRVPVPRIPACRFDTESESVRIRISHVTVPQLLDVVRMARQLQLSGYSRLYPESA